MPRPKRTFVGIEGEPSVGLAGADGIRVDLDNTFRMFDPTSTFPDGTPGGIGSANLQDGAVIEQNIANQAVSEAKVSESFKSKLLRVGSPVVDLNDLSVLLDNSSGSGAFPASSRYTWYDVRETALINLFKIEMLNTPTGEVQFFSLFSQRISIRVKLNAVDGLNWTRNYAYKFRILVEFPSHGSENFSLYEETSYSEGERVKTIVFNPMDYIPYSDQATMQVKLQVAVGTSGADVFTSEFLTNTNRTLTIIPMGGVI